MRQIRYCGRLRGQPCKLATVMHCFDKTQRARVDNSGEAPPTGPLLDWRHYEFFSVDSPHAIRLEDAVHISSRDSSKSPDSWSLDLKVVHPLPLADKASLNKDAPTLCLGFADQLSDQQKSRPSLSLVIATNTHALIDSEVAAVRLSGASNEEATQVPVPDQDACPAAIVEKLTLLRLAALRISIFAKRELKPEHAVSIIMTHAQKQAIEIARNLPSSPSLVVLRSTQTRQLNEGDARKLGFKLKSTCFEISAGSRIPMVLRQSDPVETHDTLRMKQSSLSGFINSVQISCALLGIEPLPAKIIDEFVPKTSQQDKIRHLSTVPAPLRNEIKERQEAIRSVLSSSAPIPL